MTVDLAIAGACPPHATEVGRGRGRFEQPTSVRGTIAVGGNARSCEALPFEGLGSRDRTWSLIESLARRREQIEGIKLSRNRGHQNALLAGLLTVEGDAVISIDADLQDDIGVIESMLDEHAAGHDIVYGVRRSRAHDSLFKRGTAWLFYRLARWGNPDMIPEHADFRLMSRRASCMLLLASALSGSRSRLSQ